MKIRFGIGLSQSAAMPHEVSAIGEAIVELGFDSIWLPEVLVSSAPDPVAALSHLAAAVPDLKLGTTLLLPGRNLVRFAKQLVYIDRASQGKLLVTIVPGLSNGAERTAVGTTPERRGEVIDQQLPLLRELLAGRPARFETSAGVVEAVLEGPGPVQQPLEFWLGGTAPSALRRCGRLGDGWLPSLCSPEDAARGRVRIEEEAQAVGRRIDPEHFGISLAYAGAPLSLAQRESIERRSPGREVAKLVPIGSRALRQMVEDFIEAGISKFVLRPLSPQIEWRRQLDELAAVVLDLQS